MRNLLEYPLTSDEVIASVDAAIRDRAEKRYIGDITVVGLHALKQLLDERPDLARIAAEEDHHRLIRAINEATNQNF